MRRVALIARREFVAYASVPSFWVALAMGPLLMALATFSLSAFAGRPATPRPDLVAIEAQDPAIGARAEAAVLEAGRLEHHPVQVSAAPDPKAATTLSVAAGPGGVLSVDIRGARLSEVALALLRHDLADTSPSRAAEIRVAQPPPAPPAPKDSGRFGRFSITVLLWLVLVGSLGMLLQAVVRERSNRALETLLSSVRPVELMIGKLLGVGALSLLVVGAWLGGGAAMAGMSLPGLGGAGTVLFHDVASFGYIAGALGLFGLAYAMYGVALIGIGALARDVPAAQNLSRPVFGLLLLVFFVALAQVAGMGEATLKSLVLIPPFTPFVLLLASPGALDPMTVGFGIAGMAATTAGLAWLGAQALRGELRLKMPRASRRLARAA
ncbi:MAG TPA: ABC transporter permease [Phenylobacterium sp.]|uniref:ABC transporter permease n=1 Tax=Phenylobacterium sp. TaxID=1871053 RepID=UPI002C110B0D|nr:ABC transporter permease [Phenylobacterium sp.]HSV02898.1 ABC transporter permease [Phenylobacterium sp.]